MSAFSGRALRAKVRDGRRALAIAPALICALTITACGGPDAITDGDALYTHVRPRVVIDGLISLSARTGGRLFVDEVVIHAPQVRTEDGFTSTDVLASDPTDKSPLLFRYSLDMGGSSARASSDQRTWDVAPFGRTPDTELVFGFGPLGRDEDRLEELEARLGYKVDRLAGYTALVSGFVEVQNLGEGAEGDPGSYQASGDEHSGDPDGSPASGDPDGSPADGDEHSGDPDGSPASGDPDGSPASGDAHSGDPDGSPADGEGSDGEGSDGEGSDDESSDSSDSSASMDDDDEKSSGDPDGSPASGDPDGSPASGDPVGTPTSGDPDGSPADGLGGERPTNKSHANALLDTPSPGALGPGTPRPDRGQTSGAQLVPFVVVLDSAFELRLPAASVLHPSILEGDADGARPGDRMVPIDLHLDADELFTAQLLGILDARASTADQTDPVVMLISDESRSGGLFAVEAEAPLVVAEEGQQRLIVTGDRRPEIQNDEMP